LDPARPAKVQAEAFFAKARRYQRGEAVMRRRLEETTRLAGSLERLEAEIAAAPPEMALLGDLAARAGRSGVSSAPGALSGVRGEKQKPRRPYQVFRSAGGRLILVGRSAADNDALTTRHARPHDLWLHAKGQAGAHVVVPLEKSESCPPDVLADAATLAVHFSDARGEGVAEVSYAERRYVRKLRKSAPGTVVLDREKVIAVRIEPDRVSRLLASKEEG
jgi:predicted ribosome quality control (RQC) complex YloA/Tae2 family protein